MATITNSIGSAGGRDFSTIQGWIDSIPADIVAAGNSYVGQCYNDSEFTSASTIGNFPTITTNSTHTITLTAASGQSFQDNASVRTNALRYNASNGVGLRRTGAYGAAITFSGTVQWLTISRLQIKTDANSSGIQDLIGGDNNTLQNLIVDTLGTDGIDMSGSGTVVSNCLAIASGTSNAGFFCTAGNVLFIACCAVRPSNITPAGGGFGKLYGTPIAQSCAVFGFTIPIGATYDGTNSKFNATDRNACTGTNNQVSVTYNSTTPFTQADAGSGLNFIPVAATALAANGFLVPANAPKDITGTARANPPTIGVWELVSATAQLFGISILNGLSTSGPKQFTRIA